MGTHLNTQVWSSLIGGGDCSNFIFLFLAVLGFELNTLELQLPFTLYLSLSRLKKKKSDA